MKKYLLGILTGMVLMIVVGVTATILYNAKDIEFNSKDTNWNVTNVEDALNDIKENYTPNSVVENEYMPMSEYNKIKEDYKYIINNKHIWDFDFKSITQEFKVPVSGSYKIELWGASGGYAYTASYPGGSGAYTSGIIELSSNDVLYINTGGQGSNATSKNVDLPAGYNGGGRGNYWRNQDMYNGSGGGATDVRYGGNTLLDRIIVAAGGGASNYLRTTSSGLGGSGGGLIGYEGGHSQETAECTISGVGYTGSRGIGYGSGGTQTSGGYNKVFKDISMATFGIAGPYGIIGYGSAGGGGGYYGGGGNYCSGGTGGGSSFISGHNGCDAIDKNSTSTNIIHTGQPNHFSGKIFSSTVMIDGEGYKWTSTKGNYVGQVQPNGSTSKGHIGNGYARITLISID